MIPVKYGPTSPATVAAIASSSSARPSATRPASIIASPCVWIAIAVSSGSPTSRPIRSASSMRASDAVEVTGINATVASSVARNPCSRPGGSTAACRCARIRNPPPTAGSCR